MTGLRVSSGRLVASSLLGIALILGAGGGSDALAQPRGVAATEDPTGPRRRVPAPRPNLWQLQTPLEAPVLELRGDEPIVNPGEEANRHPLGGGDLSPTIDVQITQEITDLAAELGSVEAIYEFVRNECEFQAYFGSRKGSVETLHQRRGNDYDLASLLIALLRSYGIPSRYAVGQVEMTTERVNGWLGVEDGRVAGSILFTHGMEGVSIFSGSPDNIVAVRARRVWVEALVPRGRSGSVWVPLDPSFKLHSIHAGIDIPEEMGLSAQAVIDEYWDPAGGGVTLPRTETILEFFQAQITDYLATNHPGLTLDDVSRAAETIPEELGTVPASLPYIVRSRDTQYSEIPANRRYQVRFHLHDGATNLIDHTFDLPTIAGRRITIDYVGATPADQTIIDTNGGIYYTDPSTVNLTPVLRLDGQDVATGAAAVGMGLSHESDIHFLAPNNGLGLPQNVVPAIFNDNVCGAAQAIGFSIDGTSETLLLPPPADDTEGLASLLYDTAVDYVANVRNADLEFGSLMHSHVTTDVSNAIVQNVVKVTFSGGVPQTFEWVGLVVDADRSVLGVWPVDRLDPSSGEPKELLILGGAQGSLDENLIFEDSYGQDSVSTLKILQLANDMGVTVYKRWNSLPLPTNTQPLSVRQAIENAILGGHEVTFPADPITAGDMMTGQWTGTGWIDMNPSNGAAGYIISGGNNGGATYESWPPEYIDLSMDDKDVTRVEIKMKGGDSPTGDSPDPDAVFTRDNEENLVFEYQVEVTYDDGSMATLPGGGGFYMKKTRNTTKTFIPGNYRFQVWISRRIWWIFNSTIARAERNVSIVGVLVREDDGSMFGGDPPKLLRVRPPMGDVPKKTLKALVIPEKAPDGSTLASAYAWSGGAKLDFKMPAMQVTDVEAAGMMPSSMVDDEDVNVEVTLPGGKTQKGYAKFMFVMGGMDELHKMTVFNVEIEKCPGAFMPQGGANDNDVDIVARALPMDLEGRFIFRLMEVSDENGWCCNAPDSLPLNPWAEDGSLFKDLQFPDQAGFNIDGIFWNHTAKTDAEDIGEATVKVMCYDYGAYGMIEADFEYEGETYKAIEMGGTDEFTRIPLDDDDNDIADMWADNAGMATDDVDNNPALGMTMGDGLSRYEEWRGFVVMGTHMRTDPDDKDLFIWDEDGIGLGVFGTLNLQNHLINEDEFNGGGSRQINFREESHHIVDQHGLWLRDVDLGGVGSWGTAEAVGSPGTGRTHINVDLAQVAADMTNPPPAGFQPVGAANRTGAANAQLIAHELGHGVAIFHHGPGTYVGNHGGDTACVMRYYFIDMNTANAMAPPMDVAAFNTFPIGTTFRNTAPDSCRSDVDVSDM